MTQTSTATATNCRTATGTVHAAIMERDGRPRPACAGSAVQAMHYCTPTDQPITCKRCEGRPAGDPADKRARAAQLRAAAKRHDLERIAGAPARSAAHHAESVAFLAGVAGDPTRTVAQRAAAAADLAERVATYAQMVTAAQSALEQLQA